MEVEDWYLPVAQAGITECSTYAVVCRLKSSPSYTITSYGGSFNHPCYPGVTVTIPKNTVARKTTVSLELKVGVVNRPYLRYPPSLHALWDWWDISNVTLYLRAQTSDKICHYEKSRSSLFIPWNFKFAKCTVQVSTSSHVIISCCKDIYGSYCIEKNNNDQIQP